MNCRDGRAHLADRTIAYDDTLDGLHDESTRARRTGFLHETGTLVVEEGSAAGDGTETMVRYGKEQRRMSMLAWQPGEWPSHRRGTVAGLIALRSREV